LQIFGHYKLTTNSVLQAYAVLLLLPDLKHSFLNSEALWPRPDHVVLHQVNFLMSQHATKRPHRLDPPENVALLFDMLWPVGALLWEPLFDRTRGTCQTPRLITRSNTISCDRLPHVTVLQQVRFETNKLTL